MPIVRQDQPTAGNTVNANRGQTNLYFIGIGSDADGATTDAPTFTGTPDGTAVAHGINFSSANTITQAQAGTMVLDRTTFRATFDPLAALPVGETVTYDVHVKDIVGWVGDWPDVASLPTGQANDAIGWTQGNYYRFDGADWNSEGGNITGTGVTDRFSSITFSIQDNGGGGGGGGTNTGALARNDISRTWNIGTSVGSSSQYTIGGQGNTDDCYLNGVLPVILSSVNDPANSASEYPFNAAASTVASAGSHGNLKRIATGSTFDQVEYEPTGNETEGDSYVYNVVAIDDNGSGAIEFTTVTINIGAAGGGGGGTNTGNKSINLTALASFSTTTARLTSPFSRDFSSVLNNPTGAGTLVVVGPFVNCSASDFSVIGNTITCTRNIGGDGNFNIDVV